ncbi:Transferase [Trema orientale]|uniref:Transferase n=1 Tax=Trema orientale TaxID=63057 RepID=A0A2P5BJ81_TREOI|nr:Transferase [Trema orientale]
MEVSIISRETVKPSSLPLNQLKPYKLCLFDQITPMTYASIMVFYRNTDPNFNDNLPQTLAQLKKSLSETLTFFYPFSGRTKENLYVEDFDAGVTYVEAKVSCSLTEFFKLKQNELLNQFVPYLPWRNETQETPQEELPQIGFQVNTFACGGIALASSLGHKITDGGTLSHFLMSWATSFRGFPQKIIRPNLSDATVVFPPRDLPSKYLNLRDKQWFGMGNLVTKRFVFDANAVATLREIAKSERVPKPSRNEALTCFVWKHASAAAAVATGTPKASVIAHAANMRPRMKSNALNTAIGNLFWWARADSADVRTEEISDLVGTLRGSLVSFNDEYLESMEGEVGYAAVTEFYDSLEDILNPEEPEKAPEIYGFTNWNGFFNEVDFGWGKPVWVGAHGKVGSEFRNLVVFVDAQGGKGIEAFVTLEENHMAVLEKDSEFLAFVCPNPEGLPVCML